MKRKHSDDFNRELERSMKDPVFRKEWEDLSPLSDLAFMIEEVKEAESLTSADVAKRCGMSKNEIENIELLNVEPKNLNVEKILKVARELGRTVHLSFPKK